MRHWTAYCWLSPPPLRCVGENRSRIPRALAGGAHSIVSPPEGLLLITSRNFFSFICFFLLREGSGLGERGNSKQDSDLSWTSGNQSFSTLTLTPLGSSRGPREQRCLCSAPRRRDHLTDNGDGRRSAMVFVKLFFFLVRFSCSFVPVSSGSNQASVSAASAERLQTAG